MLLCRTQWTAGKISFRKKSKMGSYNSYKIDANTTDTNITQSIVEFLRTHKREGDCTIVWRKWNEQSKWGPEDIIIELTKKFPSVMFKMEQNGESGYGCWFFLNGVEVSHLYCLPKWPSVSAFRNGFKQQEKVRKERNEAYQKKMAEEAEKRKQEEISKLKSRLQELDGA